MARHFTLDRTLGVAACFGAILAAGCGGGGGGGDGPAAPQLLQITTQNQVAVARAMFAGAISLDGLDDVPLVASAAATPVSRLSGLTTLALGKTADRRRAADAMARPLAVSTRTESCPFSGSITLMADDRDSNGVPSAGDVLTVAFNQCRNSRSDLANGTVVVTIVSYSSAPTSTQISATLTADRVSFADDAFTASLNGAATIAYSETIDAAGTRLVRSELKSGSSGLVAAGSSPGFNDTFTYDPGFTTLSVDSTPSAPAAVGFGTSSVNGTLHIASLGNRIVLTTTTPFHQSWDQAFPDSGQCTIKGERSQLRLTVLNTSTIRLDLDDNDDGAFEATRSTAWTEMVP